jgi:hypothetical protein
MTIGDDGRNLVFLVSQPRAGSTLLQRILGQHPEIHTVAEPWLMLPLIGVLLPSFDEPDHRMHRVPEAVRDFVRDLPGGDEDYLQGVRRMATHIYDCALHGSGKRLFLDKTPRYFEIVPELLRALPGARFVFLLRNPLAVLHSIVEAWCGWSWLNLARYRADLLDGPRLLVEGIEKAGDRGIGLRYESLVADPEAELERVCRHLGIDFDAAMVDYGGGDLGWRFGDREGVRNHSRPVGSSVDRWVEGLACAQSWRLADDYLRALGPAAIEALGYDFGELSNTLARHRPGPSRRAATCSLSWLLAETAGRRGTIARAAARLSRRYLGPRPAAGRPRDGES